MKHLNVSDEEKIVIVSRNPKEGLTIDGKYRVYFWGGRRILVVVPKSSSVSRINEDHHEPQPPGDGVALEELASYRAVGPEVYGLE